MSSTVGSVAHRGHRVPFLTILALSAGALVPASAMAAPPVAVMAAIGAIGQGEYGAIKGRLVWGGDTVPPVEVLRDKGKADKDPQVCAHSKAILARDLVVDPKTKGIEYAFAYLSRPRGKNPEAIKELMAAKPKAVIDQLNCEFRPYLTPIYKDQTLVVKSSDPGINHNVRMIAFNNPGLNQNIASGGSLELQLIPEKRPITLRCDIHPWMQSYVMVFDHPFFATTGKDGGFVIKGVPAGTQRLVVWQERVGYVNKGAGAGMSVKVTANEATDVGEIVMDPAKVKK